MALAPTDIQQQINEKLLKLRQLHDDPNSGISDSVRATLNKALYGQNMLGRSTTPIKAENVFPLTNELGKAADDVTHGRTTQWDPQHPFMSAGSELRDVAGTFSPFLAPVTAALDTLALPIRAVGRPAIESLQGRDPQLNFIEKAARSLTSDRDIGDVAARRTAADYPNIVQKYMTQGMNPDQAAARAQGDLTRNWMLGGTAENVMNLADPALLLRGMGGFKKSPAPAPVPTTVTSNVPTIPEMNIPSPEFGPNAIEQSASKTPFKMVETIDGMQPAPIPLEQSLNPIEQAAGAEPSANQTLHTLIQEKLKGQDPAEVQKMLGELNQRMVLDQHGPGSLTPATIDHYAQQIANNFLKKKQGFSPADTYLLPEGQGQRGFRGLLGKKTQNPESPGPVLSDTPYGPFRDQGQQEFDFTKGPDAAPSRDTTLSSSSAKPTFIPQDNMIQMSAQMQKEIDGILRTPNGARNPAYRGLDRSQLEELFMKRANKPVQQLPPAFDPQDIAPVMGKSKGATQSDVANEFASPEDIAQRDKAVNNSSTVAAEVQRLKQEPNYYENFDPRVKDAVDNLVEDHFVASKTGNKAEVDRIEKILNTVMDDTGAVHPNMTPEKALDLLKSPTAVDDLKTIIKGIRPESGLGMSMGVPRTKLTPEAQAAIQRWKDAHGPAILAALKISGKDAATFFKEQFPDISDDHINAMAAAVTDLAPTVIKGSAPKGEVPVTTKEGRGQYKGKVNLSVYSSPDVAGKIMDIVDKNPDIAKGMKLTDKDVSKMADEISAGERVSKIWRAIQESPTGQLPAEIRSEGTQLASKIEGLLGTDFGKDISGLKATMDSVLGGDLKARTKTSSEMGRALREFGLPVDGQKKIAAKFQELLDKYKNDPIAGRQIQQLRRTILSKEFNPSLWDKAYYIWINGLLSGPKTQVVNTASNALHMLNKFPDRALESLLDAGISTKTGARSTTMDEIPRMWKAMFSKDTLPEEFRYNAGTKTFEDSKNISPLQDKYSKKLEPLMYGTKLLAKSDQFFGNKVAQMEHAALQGKGLTDMEMKNLIGDEAAFRTLTRAPSAVTKVLLYAKQNLPGFRWIAPFIRTSADIIGQATEHTPIGAYGIIRSAKEGTLTQRELTQRSARIVKGTLLGVYAYDQWKKGNLVGDAPKDTKGRNHFLEVQHKQENSIKINNKWVPLSNVEPIGSVLSEFVNFYEGADSNYKSDKSAANAFMSGVMKAGVALGNKRYLAGVSNVMNAAADPQTNAPKVLGQIAAGFVPGSLKTVTDQMDTKVRKATTIPEMIQKRIPGQSQKLPPVRDIFGRDTTKPSGLNLFNIKDATQRPEDRVVNNTPMSKPQTTISGKKLLPQEVALLQQRAGQYKKQLVMKFAAKLESLPQDRKQYLVDQISSIANERARMEFERDHPKYRPTFPFSK